MSNPFPSKYPNTCPRCHGAILVGEIVCYPNLDSKFVVHERCPPQAPAFQNATAPLAAGPATAGPLHEGNGAENRVFVQIAAWVPIDRVDIMLKAIVEARA